MGATGKGPLRIAIEDFINTSPVGRLIRGWFTTFIEGLEKAIAGEYKPYFDELNKVKGIEGKFDVDKLSSGSGLHQGGVFSAVGFASSFGSGAASSFLAPIFRMINYKADNVYKSARLDPSATIAGYWRDESFKKLLESDLNDLGWTSERIKLLTELSHPRLTQAELIASYYRGFIPKEQVRVELAKRGYLPEDIEAIFNISPVIPPVADLISMATREAWNEDVVRRFKYDDELPSEAANEAAKQGLSPEWFKRYWRSHWNVVSPTQAYEMLHRLRPDVVDHPFTLEDMRLLLKTADYPEFFRDRLIDISYSPLTRVDVRRMYGEGVLTKEQVQSAYQDLGYSEENAKFLTEFTVRYESKDGDTTTGKKKALSVATFIKGYVAGVIDENTLREKLARVPLSSEDVDFEVSLANIEKASGASVNYQAEYNKDLKSLVEKEYSARFIDKSQATELLSSIGMQGQDIERCLSIADYKANAAKVDQVLGMVEAGYITGEIDFQQAVGIMGKIGLTGASQDTFISTWNVMREVKVKPLTEAQYRSAFNKGVITAQEYQKYLENLGYSPTSVKILVTMFTQDDTNEE